MASTYLSRTPSSNGSETKGTFSAWVKKTGLGDYYKMYTSYQASNEFLDIQFNNADQLAVTILIGGSTFLDLRTTRLFRDPSAWYHIVVVIDSTDSTQADRCKIYVNGERITDFATNTNNVSSSGTNMRINSTSQNVYVGSWHNADYFEGVMTHVHWIDGTAYQASTFGETDSTSGIWKPKTAPSVTYGTNGFFLKFENSGAMGTDSSGNSNTFTVNGSMTQNIDSPTNNFNTLNPNAYSTSGVSLAHGNTSFNSGSGVQYGFAIPSFALNKGKWYFEAKIGHTCAGLYIGDINQVQEAVRNSTRMGVDSHVYSWECNGYMQNNNSQTSYGSTAAAGDIIGQYIDLDNNKLYIAVNGTIQNSGTGFSITDPDSLQSGYYYVGGIADQCGATANVTAEMNYGGGKFGVTAISSAQADANGEGIFEYSPNDGGASSFDGAAKNFYALNTKNIKEFG